MAYGRLRAKQLYDYIADLLMESVKTTFMERKITVVLGKNKAFYATWE